MVKTCLTIFVLFSFAAVISPTFAGPGGCADCSDEELCTDCRDFYAEIARQASEFIVSPSMEYRQRTLDLGIDIGPETRP